VSIWLPPTPPMRVEERRECSDGKAVGLPAIKPLRQAGRVRSCKHREISRTVLSATTTVRWGLINLRAYGLMSPGTVKSALPYRLARAII